MHDRNVYPSRAATPIEDLGHMTSEELIREAQDSPDPLTRALAMHLAKALDELNRSAW